MMKKYSLKSAVVTATIFAILFVIFCILPFRIEMGDFFVEASMPIAYFCIFVGIPLTLVMPFIWRKAKGNLPLLSAVLNVLLFIAMVFFWYQNETACSRVHINIAPNTKNWFPREFSPEEIDLLCKAYPVIADAEKKENPQLSFYIHDIEVEEEELTVIIGYFEMFLEPNIDYEVDGREWNVRHFDGIGFQQYTLDIKKLSSSNQSTHSIVGSAGSE